MPSLHTNTGAKRARTARATYSLDPAAPLPDVLTTVETTTPVVVHNFPTDFAGAVVRRNSNNLIFVNAAHPPVRQRFTLAHELGHICCDHDTTTIVDSVAMFSGEEASSVEVQANAFAAEFLVPRVAVQEQDPEPDLERIVRLGCEYGVSAIAMLYRFKTAKRVSEPRATRLALEIEDGDDKKLIEHLGLERMKDRLSALTDDDLPYISPSLEGSALGAAVNGTASIEAAARAASTPARRLATAIHP